MSREVIARAPTRVDYGGGTLDIFPLYLFFNGGITINAAIDLEAKVWVTARPDDRITIRSLDTGAALACEGGLTALPEQGPLALITRLLRYYQPVGGLEVVTQLQPPHGSGLGASSALFIALAHALLAYKGEPREDLPRIIRICNGLEAQLMGMPAGMQDYYPPTYGGINAVHYDLDGIRVEPLDPSDTFLPALQQHTIVTYTNITHHSGTTNWGKIKNYFDGVPRTVRSLQRIKVTATDFYRAFTARDIPQIADLLHVEWENRKGLADGVTSPAIDHLIETARDHGAWASKLCGAGGGGCLMTLAPPDARARVIHALIAAGATYLDAHLVREGVQVEVNG